jgi:hypothetical protein
MKKNSADDQSELIARLQQLKETPPRDPEAARLGRARFLAEARRLQPAVSPSPTRRLRGWIANLKAKEILVMNRRFSSAYTLAIVAVVVVALFGGSVATAYAAKGALPGSPLHPVKTGLERAQLALSLGDARDARLSLGFAERRLEELAGLIEAGRFDELAPVVSAFEVHIQTTLEGLKSVSLNDPAEAQRLASAVTAALSRYAGLLMQFSAAVPTDAQAPLLQALEVSNQSFQIEMIGTVVSIGSPTWQVLRLSDGTTVELGVNENTELQSGIVVGDLVKVEAIQDSSGMLWAVEIESADDESGQNDNGDDDVNANTNENENENANDNEVGENENEGLDDNDNDDLDENDNDDLDENDNDDAGENDNDNANENDNENANENENENANQNANENDNENDNEVDD